MLDQVRLESVGRRRHASPVEFSLLLAAIVVLVALVAFAFGYYLRSAFHPACQTSVASSVAAPTCTPGQS